MEDLGLHADELRVAVRNLEGRLERQALVLRALFTLAAERLAITEDELLNRVRALAPAGGMYARPTPPRRPCPECGSTLGHRRNRCLFCGKEWQLASAFELLEMEAGPAPAPQPAEPAPRLSEAIRPAPRQDS